MKYKKMHTEELFISYQRVWKILLKRGSEKYK